MIYTKSKFKKLWDANSKGSGITYDDIADCAKAWGLYVTPRIHPMDVVKEAVIKSAKCKT